MPEITLTVIGGPHLGQVFTFQGRDNFVVGREPPCHFVLPDKDETISRVHFLIEVNPPLCQLTDLASSNGTFVNGSQVTSTVLLKDGDEIRAGKTVFRVVIRQPLDPTILLGIPVDEALAPPEMPPGYEWIRELGRGGMGTVHLAQALHSGQLCAVKTIQPAVNATRRDVDRFLREIRVLSTLSHPHIVAFHQFEVLRGRFYLIMEFVAGIDAAQVLDAEGLLTVPRAATWTCQVLDALEYAHSQGFVHRDIKPANLLIAQERNREIVKVADFGLARTYEASRLSGLTRVGDVGGTLAFMPPEQITAYRQTRPTADQYAAAATLYFLLTGQYVHDFPMGTSARLLKILHDDAISIRARRPDLSESLAAVIHRALQRDPAQRFASAAAMRRELLPFAAPPL